MARRERAGPELERPLSAGAARTPRAHLRPHGCERCDGSVDRAHPHPRCLRNVSQTAQFSCDLSQRGEAFAHFWELCVGSDHAPMALRADWQAQLRRAHRELGFRYVRFHGLLSDRMFTLTCQQERLVYSFFNIDRIFDFLLSIGMRPFIELSFMPRTLASGSASVFSYEANITPPRDLAAWGELIRRLVTHWVERYGAAEVRTWYFEVWNEPNLESFWTGTQAQYFELYRGTAQTVKALDAQLRIGGPATANNGWIGEFIGYCRDHQVPLDFVSTHHYPTDAFGAPGDDTVTQLAASRRSVLREDARRVRQLAQGYPVYYTEWNSSSNPRDPLHDEPYAACFAVKTVLEAHGLVEGYSFWTFSDIFEENYLPSQPFHGGFGLLNLQGIAKPTYRAFQLLHGLGDELLQVEGEHPTADAWVVRGRGELTVVLTNFALPRHPLEEVHVTVALEGAGAVSASCVRIDEAHANAKAEWIRMGSPEYPSVAQLRALEQESRLRWRAEAGLLRGGTLRCSVPPLGVVAVRLRPVG
ncbi:MAG: beta-xylosidase [Gammaproteobacteria bacterium]|nr:beta-xylosidase [Gammaproteobacteria bacterium]